MSCSSIRPWSTSWSPMGASTWRSAAVACAGRRAGTRLAAAGVLESCLGAVLDAEFGKQMLHVKLDGVVGQAEAFGDLGVAKPGRHERPDLALAGCEVSGGARPATLDPAPRGLGEDKLPRVHLADGRQRLLG